MLPRKVNLDNLPSSIKEFFTPEEYANIPDYERFHLKNIRRNFEALRKSGLPVQPPEFMMRLKSEKAKKEFLKPIIDMSSEGSDSEWTPAEEIPKKRTVQRRKAFDPPYKSSAKMKKSKNEISSPTQRKTRKAAKVKAKETIPVEEDGHVYSLRKRRMSSYMSLAIPDDDDFLYCEECNFEYNGDCPEHGPLLIVEDSVVSQCNDRGGDPDYCRHTLPPGLAIRQSRIPQAGIGVFATKNFPARTRFGPYGGRKEMDQEKAHDSGYCWQIYKDGKPSHFVDASDPCSSNWMRFVNCARSEDEQCVTAYQYQGEIFYRAHRDIAAGSEILVYYGDSYARDLGIQAQRVGVPNRRTSFQGPLTEKDGVHSCAHCHLAFSHPIFLERHMRRRHGEKYSRCRTDDQHCIVGPGSCWSMEPSGRINTQQNNVRISGNVDGDVTSIETNKMCAMDQQQKSTTAATDHILMTKKTEKVFKHVLELENHQSNGLGGGQNVWQIGSFNIKNSLQVCAGRKESLSLQCHISLDLQSKREGGERLHHCDVCGKGFTHSNSLVIHKRTHTGERPYNCDVCGKGFTHSNSLVIHKRTHTGERPYNCDVCGKGFTRSDSLVRHKRTHTRERLYSCEVCGKGFTHSNSLVIHKRTHTGERPYNCDVCGKRFTHSNSLVIHKRTHTGERPYNCDVCGKGFTHSNSLVMHKRTHTGERPYNCDVCGKGFINSSNLVSHKRTHIGD